MMQSLVDGLAQGSIYGLAAIGLSLIFGVVRVPHFAHGEAVMLGGMVGLVLVSDSGLPLLLGLVAGTLAALVDERVLPGKGHAERALHLDRTPAVGGVVGGGVDGEAGLGAHGGRRHDGVGHASLLRVRARPGVAGCASVKYGRCLVDGKSVRG